MSTPKRKPVELSLIQKKVFGVRKAVLKTIVEKGNAPFYSHILEILREYDRLETRVKVLESVLGYKIKKEDKTEVN